MFLGPLKEEFERVSGIAYISVCYRETTVPRDGRVASNLRITFFRPIAHRCNKKAQSVSVDWALDVMSLAYL